MQCGMQWRALGGGGVRTDDGDEPIDVDGGDLGDAHDDAHEHGPHAHAYPGHHHQPRAACLGRPESTPSVDGLVNGKLEPP